MCIELLAAPSVHIVLICAIPLTYIASTDVHTQYSLLRAPVIQKALIAHELLDHRQSGDELKSQTG
jgi:hypothetical protein